MYFCACSVHTNQQRLFSVRSCRKIGNESTCGKRSRLRELVTFNSLLTTLRAEGFFVDRLDVLVVLLVEVVEFALEVGFDFFFDDDVRVASFLSRHVCVFDFTDDDALVVDFPVDRVTFFPVEFFTDFVWDFDVVVFCALILLYCSGETCFRIHSQLLVRFEMRYYIQEKESSMHPILLDIL